ncbi:Threonine/serine dehydratase [Sulfidibacter corallicola]|uniref:Threonine/serine dehydratase n=1 Tax=Sulfidibacter corallicola TaxID=2818388 RepID=A0A8A4TSW2_SULCO|nr:threonine/serine dehydratase [Sulfidibacter corallicola]QTD52630.1 threonine/serine dehydratase [Sulfidibacter corallicola]
MNLILEDILAARIRIKHLVHKTPLLRSRQLNRLLGCDLYFKAESLQKVGAFKARGVCHFLSREETGNPVVTTYSSGNHGQALAWAASQFERKAVVFMPEDASQAKVAAVRGYGGEVRFAGLSGDDRQAACEAFAAETGALVVPPFDHPHIIAGQGTVLLEIVEELPTFDALLVPTGGGGLLAGNALALKALRRNAQIFACEPELAADARASLASGELQRIEYAKTIADGARNLCLGNLNWDIIRRHVDGGLAAPEFLIVEAMRELATFTKQYVEPSGALGLACLMGHRDQFKNKTVVIILSGGNIALEDYARLITSHGAKHGSASR